MAASHRSCRSPKDVSVRGYARTGARKKFRPVAWWECYSGGHGCGIHHATKGTSYRHCARLDKAERRRGRRADWQPRHKTR